MLPRRQDILKEIEISDDTKLLAQPGKGGQRNNRHWELGVDGFQRAMSLSRSLALALQKL